MPVPRQIPHGKVDTKPVLIPVPSVSDLLCMPVPRQILQKPRLIQNRLSYLYLTFQTCGVYRYPVRSLTARLIQNRFSYLYLMFQTCGVYRYPVRSLRARLIQNRFSYLYPVFQTCGVCRCPVRSLTARWTSCPTTGSGRWRGTRVRTATRWWVCRPECVRGTRRGTGTSLAVNSTTDCWVRRHRPLGVGRC